MEFTFFKSEVTRRAKTERLTNKIPCEDILHRMWKHGCGPDYVIQCIKDGARKPPRGHSAGR